jgi:ATP-dependent Clp protease ATP-binding subunit ClpA
MSAVSTYVRDVLDQAAGEAQAGQSKTVEAQHVMLAIAAQPGSSAAGLLRSVGLDPPAIREALRREVEHSLNAAGVSLAGVDLPPATSAPQEAPPPGVSVKQALERGMTGVREPRPEHLLLGILQAEHGAVPRALALAGIDRADLLERVQRTLENAA